MAARLSEQLLSLAVSKRRSNTMKLTKSVLLLAVVLAAGCAGLPQTSRSGTIHNVTIERGISPSDLIVGIGDEVRWINHRSGTVQIDFLGNELDRVSCARGFSNWIGTKKESATIKANQSASLCFSHAGAVSYNVRMDDMVPGGKVIEPGIIRVGRLGSVGKH
jgi:plastocyanin